MTQFVIIDEATRCVLYSIGSRDPTDLEGPPCPQPDAEKGTLLMPWQERLDFGAGPTPSSVLCWPAGASAPTWIETATLEELKARKNAEINAARVAANLEPFLYEGKYIACDTDSLNDINRANGYIALFGTFPSDWQGWKCADNTYLPIATVEEWKGLYSAMVHQGTANLARAQDLKQQLAAATTADQVAAIQWQP